MAEPKAIAELRAAWQKRKSSGVLEELQAVRIFHGPGEGSGPAARIAVDRFGEHFWITEWSEDQGSGVVALLPAVKEFLEEIGARSAVALLRPSQGLPQEPQLVFGEPPEGRFVVAEAGAKFWIQLRGARHPGLFLDHLPLRRWLMTRMRGKSVLNTFSYTGSLSVAAALGGASEVTTLDLSRATVDWAKENWSLNELDPARGSFMAGDYFECLPRLRREGRRFDCVILDPPSFSRGKKGNFSTAKDLRKLHSLAFSVLAPGGLLVTSINSANVAWAKFEAEVAAAAREHSFQPRVLSQIDLPETFPTRFGKAQDRYLKGWILQV